DVGQLLGQRTAHARIHPHLAAADGPDGLHQSLACRILEDHSLGAEAEGSDVLLLLIAGSEHQDVRVRADLQHGGHGIEPAALGHADVEQQHVGPRLPDQLDDVLRALRVGDDLDVLLRLEAGAQPPAEQRVVVHDHYATFAWCDTHRKPPPTDLPAATGISSETSEPWPGLLQTRSDPPSAAVRSRIDHGALAGLRKPSTSMEPSPFGNPRPLSRMTR